MNIKAILCDIEGTTTSVSFVYETLFPYFEQHIGRLLTLLHDPVVAECFLQIKQTLQQQGKPDASSADVLAKLRQWVLEDKKETTLKALQGIIWREGYLRRELKGHLYDDVFPAFQAWHQQGISLNIYSSGSVTAQKLLFAHTEKGDLTPILNAYFDTTSGAKREVGSYQNISQSLNLAATDILFLSDIEAELDAAKEAGLNTIQIVRAGTEKGSNHPIAHTFTEISS